MTDGSKTYTGNPPTKIDSASNQFNAPVLAADDTQASIVSKLLAARSDPHAEEVGEATAVAARLRAKIVEAEQDENLSPAGVRDRVRPHLAEAREVIAKLEETATSAEAYATKLEGHAQDFEWEAPEADRIFARAEHARDAATSPAARQAKGRAFIAACNTDFKDWKEADGALVRSCLDAADLGCPIIEPLHLNAGYQALQAKHVASPDVAGLRSRAAALRGAAGSIRVDVDRAAKRLGLTEVIG